MHRWLWLFLAPFLLFADPWGKDADMLLEKKLTPRCRSGSFGPFAEAMIAFHQKVISPANGPRSHFYPTSSQYTLNAMRKYGFFKGYILGCDRLMRENDDPWVYCYKQIDKGVYLKYNPVR